MSTNGQDHELIPGTEIQLGRKKYVVPPLNLEGLEKHEADIERAQEIETSALTGKQAASLKEQYNLIASILLTAMQRNYPEMELAYLKKVVDLGNATMVFQAVMGQSGYAQTTGEASASE